MTGDLIISAEKLQYQLLSLLKMESEAEHIDGKSMTCLQPRQKNTYSNKNNPKPVVPLYVNLFLNRLRVYDVKKSILNFNN